MTLLGVANKGESGAREGKGWDGEEGKEGEIKEMREKKEGGIRGGRKEKER